MLLEVQICTYGVEGIARVSNMKIPQLDNVCYTICFQNPLRNKYILPEPLLRDDIRILEHVSSGLSYNRNYGLERAIGDIILIADDDLNYSEDGLESVINVFNNNPLLDFATFKHSGGDNKLFPAKEFDFKHKEPKGYYLTSFELAVRKKALPKDIRFSPQLGIGAQFYGAGEESVFLYRLKNRGLNGRFFPITIVEHPNITTGVRESSPSFLRAQGAWIWIRYGWIKGVVKLIKDSYIRKLSMKGLFFLWEGYTQACKNFEKNGKDKL